MKRILILLLSALLVVSMLAGCAQTKPGGDVTDGGDQAQTSGDPSADNGTDDEGKANAGQSGSDDKAPTGNSASKKASEGLEFKLNGDGGSYYVAGIGSCKDKDIVVPDTYEGLPVTMIGHRAFMRCSNITSITLPDSIETIGQCPFENCSALTELVIGAGLQKVYEDSLSGCSNALRVSVSSNNTAFCSQDNCVIEKATGKLILAAKDAVIPSDGSVKILGRDSFVGAKWLTALRIPEGVEKIEPFAFENCAALADVSFPSTLKSIGYGAFQGCRALTEVTVPGSVETVDSCAFAYCTSLTKAVVSGGVKTVFDAFKGCTALTNAYLPESLTFIEYTYMFSDCGPITVNYAGTQEDWKQICNPGKLEGFKANGNITVVCTDGTLVYEPITFE